MWHLRDNWLLAVIIGFPVLFWLIYPSFHAYPHRGTDPVPVSPEQLNISVQNNSVTVDWKEVSWWRSYNLYISEHDDFSNAREIFQVTPPYQLSDLQSGKVYYFAVTSVNWSGESDKTNKTIVVLQNDEPSSFSVRASSGSNILKWNKVAGANSYVIYWKKKNDSNSIPTPIMVSGAKTTYRHTGLQNYHEYEYQIIAHKMRHITGLSKKLTAVPLAGPSELAVKGGDHEIQLVWQPAERARSYSIYIGDQPDFNLGDAKQMVKQLRGNKLTVAGLENGQTYYYAVTADTPLGESDRSNVVAIKPRISTPKNLSVMVADGSNYLLWDPVPGAKTYRVYWSSNGLVDESSQYFDVDASVPVVTHNGVKPETSYFYRIAAHDKKTNSGLSSMAASIASRVYPPPGEYSAGQQVFLTCKNKDDYDCEVFYSTNAESFRVKVSPYQEPILLDETTTITYFAKDKAGNVGPEKTVTYTIRKDKNTVVKTPEKPAAKDKNYIRAKSA